MSNENGQSQATLPLPPALPAPRYKRPTGPANFALRLWFDGHRIEIPAMKNAALCEKVHADLSEHHLPDSTIIALRREQGLEYAKPAPPRPTDPAADEKSALAEALDGLWGACEGALEISCMGLDPHDGRLEQMRDGLHKAQSAIQALNDLWDIEK